MDEAYQRTLNLLRSRKDDVEKVAKLLLDKETITHDDVLELVGPRPFKTNPQYDEFIRRFKDAKADNAKDPKDGEGSPAEEKESLGPVMA